MAEINLDITSLLERAFGIGRGKPFDGKKAYQKKIDKAGEFDVPDLGNQEGTEVINMRDVLGSNLPNGQPLFMPMAIGGILLPNEPTVYITGRKNIIETFLVGSKRKGSVKELIGFEDYQITIRGIAINYNSTKIYPEDEVKSLHDLYLKAESLEVQSALTSLFGIYRLVIKSVTFPEMIGIQHAQAYEFQCVSDEDFILEL